MPIFIDAELPFAALINRFMEAPPLVVLIVEDEALIRLTLADALTDGGIEVKEAGHASEAIEILERYASGLGLMFTDVNMPGGMDGLELAHYVRQHWPWIALIVTSGTIQAERTDLPADARFLPKPYKFDDMPREVRMLAGKTLGDPSKG